MLVRRTRVPDVPVVLTVVDDELLVRGLLGPDVRLRERLRVVEARGPDSIPVGAHGERSRMIDLGLEGVDELMVGEGGRVGQLQDQRPVDRLPIFSILPSMPRSISRC